jgi:hypothetical protein
MSRGQQLPYMTSVLGETAGLNFMSVAATSHVSKVQARMNRPSISCLYKLSQP